MNVIRAHKVHTVAGHSFVTNPNVGLDVFHNVTHMESAVRIWKGGGHEECAFAHGVGEVCCGVEALSRPLVEKQNSSIFA